MNDNNPTSAKNACPNSSDTEQCLAWAMRFVVTSNYCTLSPEMETRMSGICALVPSQPVLPTYM